MSIVVDPGSFTTKIGVSGNSSPTFILPSKIPGQQSFVTNSYISDFTAFEQYLESLVTDQLKISLADWPILTAIPCHAHRRYSENLAEVYFETFNSPGVSFEEAGVLGFHGTTLCEGFNPTACIVEIGHCHTTISAVVEGYLVAAEKFSLAGKHISEFWTTDVMEREFLKKSPDVARKVAKIAGKAKETFGFVAEDVKAVHAEFQRNFRKHKKEFGGIEFGYSRFLGSELLFDPGFKKLSAMHAVSIGGLSSIYGCNGFPGLGTAIEQLVMTQVPVDYRKRLIGNLVLCGGSSLLTGLEKRLKKELPKNLRPEFFDWGTSALQGHAVWTGASVVADSPDFGDRLITRKLWDEEGSRIFSLKKFGFCVAYCSLLIKCHLAQRKMPFPCFYQLLFSIRAAIAESIARALSDMVTTNISDALSQTSAQTCWGDCHAPPVFHWVVRRCTSRGLMSSIRTSCLLVSLSCCGL
jgi:actin-related protein 3